MERVVRHTSSVCPVCFRRISASIVERTTGFFIEKECSEHGFFSAVTWRGRPPLPDWTGTLPEMDPTDAPGCPDNCGLCPDHLQQTCCVLLEVTSRCNLACPHCFAGASPDTQAPDPSLEQVLRWVEDIGQRGRAFLQLSGGEPTMRDDLPQIVRHARQWGCEYVQLNSNGLRLADDPVYVQALADAGLSFVFMQFDGVSDAVYRQLRGADLLATKMRAIEMCGHYNIGVTLVPTVVPGVNDGQVGDILRLATSLSPVVRGVHFQPVSYFGRFPKPPSDADRITLPEVLACIYAQAGELVPAKSIAKSRCDHARCGFHGAYIVLPDQPCDQQCGQSCDREGIQNSGQKVRLKALTAEEAPPCCGPTSAEKNREFVGSRWRRPETASICESKPLAMTPASCCESKPLAMAPASCCESTDSQQAPMPAIHTLDGFLQRAATHSFTISAMAFQDAYTLDIERLRQCSLHVYDRGRIVPFCAYYLR